MAAHIIPNTYDMLWASAIVWNLNADKHVTSKGDCNEDVAPDHTY